MEQLADYLDEDVHAELRKAVDEHLHSCRDCSYYVDTVRKTVILFKADQRIEMPLKATVRLHEALAAEYALRRQRPAAPPD
jgi:predicted anti-sigma-YlaC factor YlaD